MQNASSNLFKTTGFVRHSVFDMCGFVLMMKIWQKRDNFTWSVLASRPLLPHQWLKCSSHVVAQCIGIIEWLAVQAMGTLLFRKHDWLIEEGVQGGNDRRILSSFFGFRVKTACLSCTSRIGQSNRISYGAGFFIWALLPWVSYYYFCQNFTPFLFLTLGTISFA